MLAKVEDYLKMNFLVIEFLHDNEKEVEGKISIDIGDNLIYFLPELYAHTNITPTLTNKDSSTEYNERLVAVALPVALSKVISDALWLDAPGRTT